MDLRRVGEDLGIRYILLGNVQLTQGALRLDLDLVSTDTGARVWAYRFALDDKTGSDGNTAPIVWALYREMVELDAARSVRERSSNPSADDVLLRARALTFSPSTPERQSQLLPLWERAAELNPTSATALAGLAEAILDGNLFAGEPETPARLRRADDLITRAELLDLRNPKAIWARIYLLGWKTVARTSSPPPGKQSMIIRLCRSSGMVSIPADQPALPR